MSDINYLKTQAQSLIDLANATTGNSDTNLTDGVNALVGGYGQGGIQLPEDMLEGLENGYDVMFYDENNKGLAFYSVRQGQTIEAPMYVCDGWLDKDKNAITFPYTPNSDIILYANIQTLSGLLYQHFGVSQTEYPYISIKAYSGTISQSRFIFAKDIVYNDAHTLLMFSEAKGISFSASLYSMSTEEIVNYIIDNFTSSNLASNGFDVQGNYSSYRFLGNFAIESTVDTNWTQFE